MSFSEYATFPLSRFLIPWNAAEWGPGFKLHILLLLHIFPCIAIVFVFNAMARKIVYEEYFSVTKDRDGPKRNKFGK